MEAHVLWQQLNRNRYRCEVCRFRSYNAAHWQRHLDSAKHWLLTEFRWKCPKDLKILIASFLPPYKLFRLPSPISRPALRLAWNRPPQYRNYPRTVLPYLVFGEHAFSQVGDLPARIGASSDHLQRRQRNLAFWVSLREQSEPSTTTAGTGMRALVHQSS